MLQVIEPISISSTETLTDVEQTQVVLNFSLSFQSLVEVITKLGLREMIQLKRLLDRKINQALGSDPQVVKRVKRLQCVNCSRV